MKFYIQLFKITLVLFFTYSCSHLPGINKNPKEQSGSNKLSNYLTIKDVTIDIIKINSLNESEINNFNDTKLDELAFSVQKYKNIYDYDYSYVLGSSDIISINLTDTDDVDGAYTIDPNGDIDLPFIGRIKIEGLDINKAQSKLISILSKYYKNPELQIQIDALSSLK